MRGAQEQARGKRARPRGKAAAESTSQTGESKQESGGNEDLIKQATGGTKQLKTNLYLPINKHQWRREGGLPPPL